MRGFMKEYTQKIRIEWGRSTRAIYREAEKLAVEQVLPQVGFSEIIWAAEAAPHFFVDALAKYKETTYAIEICSGLMHKFSKGKWKILEYLNLPLLVCFIRPNLQEFKLMKVPAKAAAIWVTNGKHIMQKGKIQVSKRSKLVEKEVYLADGNVSCGRY